MARIKNFSTSFLKRLPIAGEFLRKRNLQRLFKVELELIRGIHSNENEHLSIIHFSINKAATQYVKKILRRCATEKGMVPVGLHEYAFHTDFPFLDHLSAGEMQKYQHIFRPNGYLYSVFGGMIEGIPDLEKYLVVLMVRDPRDILVSEYYSIAYSHPEPSKRISKYDGFMEKRRTARQITIDEYVIGESDRVHNVYQRYLTQLLNHYPQVYLTTYEDMASDFRIWLEGLLEYCELEISNELLQSLLKDSEQLQPKKEVIYQHIRKGKPGDHKEKLKQETIDYLNSKFSSILKEFEYR